MAVPKKKKSKSRVGMHRAHNFLTARRWVNCAQCKEPKLLHHVCGHCGFYRSKEVIAKD
jgi:large subunit ribosomal protein L32